jgi:hypothetical protein
MCYTNVHIQVMLSRHRCGLVIVGDFNVTGPYGPGVGKKGNNGGGDDRKKKVFVSFGLGGLMTRVKAGQLMGVHEALQKAGRAIGRVRPDGLATSSPL